MGKFVLASPALLNPELFKKLIKLINGSSESLDELDFISDNDNGCHALYSAYLGSIGTGYDMAKNTRRPVYPALMPGTCMSKATGERLELSSDPETDCCWGSLAKIG